MVFLQEYKSLVEKYGLVWYDDKKPLKRLTLNYYAFYTSLKRGVNDKGIRSSYDP